MWYHKHVEKHHSGQPFKKGIIIGKTKTVTGPILEEVGPVSKSPWIILLIYQAVLGLLTLASL